MILKIIGPFRKNKSYLEMRIRKHYSNTSDG